MGDWSFLSNYGHVLVCLARNRKARLRDVALEVGITERAVQKIVRELQDSGYLTVTKQGRCNRYAINKRKSLRHGVVSHCNVGRLLALLTGPSVEPRPGPADKGLPAPAGEAAPSDTSESPSRADPPERTGRRKKKKADDDAPVDTRQQGSLF